MTKSDTPEPAWFFSGDESHASNLILVLLDDIRYLDALIERRDHQAVRRQWVRAVYALVEASVWDMKEFCVDMVEHSHAECSSADLTVLREVAIQVTQSGKVKEMPLRLGFRQNVKFTLRVTREILKGHGRTDFAAAGWADLQSGIEVRDRLTHPKQVGDLDVDDAELTRIKSGLHWFLSETVDLQDIASAFLLRTQERLDKVAADSGRLAERLSRKLVAMQVAEANEGTASRDRTPDEADRDRGSI